MWRNYNTHTLLAGMYDGATTLENSLVVLQNVKLEFAYDLVIPKEKFKNVYTKTQVFKAIVFTIAKKGTQCQYPLIDEWINKMWYICMLEYFLSRKKIKYWHKLQNI